MDWMVKMEFPMCWMKPFGVEGRNYCRPFDEHLDAAGNFERFLACIVGQDFEGKYWEDIGDGRVAEELSFDLKNSGEGS